MSEIDQIVKALKAGINPNDCTDEYKKVFLGDQKESIQEKVDSLMSDAYEAQTESDMAYELRALGGSSKIGPLEFQNVMGNLVLLNMVDSPFMSGELGEEVSFEEICKALYVLFHGKEAIEPIMSIAERISDLYSLKDICKDNPLMCDKVIAKVEEISEARKTFVKDSIDFYEEHFTGEALQSVCDDLVRVLMEAAKAFEEVESSSEQVSKKKS